MISLRSHVAILGEEVAGLAIPEMVRRRMGGPPEVWSEEQQSRWLRGWRACEDGRDCGELMECDALVSDEERSGWEARAAIHARP